MTSVDPVGPPAVGAAAAPPPTRSPAPHRQLLSRLISFSDLAYRPGCPMDPVREPADPRGSDGGSRMTEEKNDETTRPAHGRPEPDTISDAVVPEDPAQAIALPADTPPPPADARRRPAGLPPPGEPARPPGQHAAPGPPAGSRRPQVHPAAGTYAMGALAGNPAPGAGAHRHRALRLGPAPPVTAPAPAGFPALRPGRTAAGRPRPRRRRRPSPTTRCATASWPAGRVAVLAAGVGIGHAAWSDGLSNPSAARLGQRQLPRGSGSSGQRLERIGSGQRFPFGGRLSATRATPATRATRAAPA